MHQPAEVYLTDYILEQMDTRQMIPGALFIDLKKSFQLGQS